MTLVSRVPTSSAYWNLRAEQVMDKVFARDAIRANEPPLVAVDVDVEEPSAEPPRPTARTSRRRGEGSSASGAEGWLITLLSGLALAGMISSGWLIGSWRQSEAQLAQERNLRLIDRMSTPSLSDQSKATNTNSPGAPIAAPPATAERTQEIPPPPEPDWVTSLEPLTIPIKAAPASELAPAPIASTAPISTPVDTPVPQLTGVVQGPGGSSSAIFQLRQSSLAVGLGDGIGNSGWTLESISETGAVIQRHGERLNLSVGGVF